MKEKPILFSAPMVRAILDNRKSVTRRVVKLSKTLDETLTESEWRNYYIKNYAKCPYGVPGDRLYVKETFAFITNSSIEDDGLFYRADGDFPSHLEDELCKWKPSIFMPRWASRINLEITNVRVERVQDISNEDAIKEGIQFIERDKYSSQDFYGVTIDDYNTYAPNAHTSFMYLWDLINKKKHSWKSNPWVWVVEFKRVESNENN